MSMKIVLRRTPSETPWLDEYRERFSKATKEAAAELEKTELRGAARVIKFNSLVREKLKAPAQSQEPGPGSVSP